MTHYAAFLNLKGKQALLFGAGLVALRKAKVLIQAGVKLNVISKDFSPAFKKFAKKEGIKLTRGSSIPSLKKVWLVIAATSDPVFNHRVFKACEKEKIFVNVVDDPKNCNFIVPSIVKRGMLQIAISTGGASPYLAKSIRRKLEETFGPEYASVVKRLANDRMRAKKTMSVKSRPKYFKRNVALALNRLGSR